MRLVTTKGLSEVLTILSIFMGNSDPNPCTPEEQIFVSVTDLDGQSALFFRSTHWSRAAWACKDAADDSYLVMFQDREPDYMTGPQSQRPVIGRFNYCNMLGPNSVESAVTKFLIQGVLPENLNPDHLQRLNTSVKKAAS